MGSKLFVVAVAGKMRSGKNVVGEHLAEKYNFQCIAFADRLKEICMCYDNGTDEMRDWWNIQIAQDLYPDYDTGSIALCVDDLMQHIQPGKWRRLTHDECHGEKTEFSRNVLQKLGEGIRKIKNEGDCWAKYLVRRCLQAGSGRFVICDLRYKSEAFLIEQIDHSQIWRVERDFGNIQRFGDKHISETDLDDYPFEVILQNDAEISDLCDKIDKVIVPFLRGDKPFFIDGELC